MSTDRWLVAFSALAFVAFAIILLAVSRAGRVDGLDLWVARAESTRSAATIVLARTVTALGSWPAVVVVAAAAIGGLWLQTRTWWCSALLASSLAATASLVTLVKIAVERAAPDASTLLGVKLANYSFPSGHTTNGTLVYVLSTLLLTARLSHPWWRRTLIVSAALLALLIGLTQLYLGYRWATDVLAGWLLAAGVIAATYFTSRQLVLPDGPAPSNPSAFDRAALEGNRHV